MLIDAGALRLTASFLTKPSTGLQERALWTLANFAQLSTIGFNPH